MKQTNTNINHALNVKLGTALQALESFLTIAENQRVRHLDPIGIGFDSSGWISRVIMEVRPHLDLTTFAPSYGFLKTGTIISRCE